MQVTIELMAQLRTALGQPARTLELDEGATLRQALQELIAAHDSEEVNGLLAADGGLSPTIIASLHGRILDPSEDPVLSHGDTLSLFSPIAGG
jgi:molybdopterin converting factor small subunit